MPIVDAYLRKVLYRFLLVSLKIEAVLGEVTIDQRRKKLEEMAGGNGLSDAYTTTITRLKAQTGNKSVLGLKVLMCVLYSEWPLRTEELCHAPGIEIGSANLDPNNVPALRTLLASCLGLVNIETSSSRVQLVHFTLHEHLLSNPTLFHSPHATIAEVCLTYLNFGSVWDLSPTLPSAPSTMPFLEYASCYWEKHMISEITEDVKRLALRILDRFNEHISAQLLVLHHKGDRSMGRYYEKEGGPTRFTGLHGASFIGEVEIVSGVLGMKEWNINETDCMECTPLTWAAEKRQDEVVKMLLERGDVNPDQADTFYGQTQLLWAAENRHEGIVNMLLEQENVNPNQPNTKYSETPLLRAANKGHEGVVKMLLERDDLNPNQEDTALGQTPLLWAAECGHEGVVKMLLERYDVNPNQPDSEYGRTPPSWAARGGHEGIIKMFLEREGINLNRAETRYGWTSLSWAANNGHEVVVKIVLERDDVNPNQELYLLGYSHTPLSWAAEKRHEAVVKMLLKREDVNPNQPNRAYGRTPLSWVAKKGHEGVVKMLLERDDVNPDQPDPEYGQTPLSEAAEQGHEGVVKMLLERKDVNHNQKFASGHQTVLWWVAEKGHEGVVKVYLG